MNRKTNPSSFSKLSDQDLQVLAKHIATRFRLHDVEVQDFSIWTNEYSFVGLKDFGTDIEASVSVDLDVDSAEAVLNRAKWIDQITW